MEEVGTIARAWATPGSAWEWPEHRMTPAVGSHGYTLPDVSGFTWHELRDGCSVGNMVVRAAAGAANNWLACPSDYSPPARTVISFNSPVASNNLLVVGRRPNTYGEVHFHGRGNLLVFAGEACHASLFNVRFWGSDEFVFVGKGTTANRVSIIVQGPGGRIVIGDDCIVADNIYVRNTDMHGIVDMRNGEWINQGGEVHVEPHVWVAQDALILKNTRIGFGSIIGAKAIVNKDVPRFCMAAGAPTKVIRREVSWDRGEKPGPDLVSRLREYERGLA